MSVVPVLPLAVKGLPLVELIELSHPSVVIKASLVQQINDVEGTIVVQVGLFNQPLRQLTPVEEDLPAPIGAKEAHQSIVLLLE